MEQPKRSAFRSFAKQAACLPSASLAQADPGMLWQLPRSRSSRSSALAKAPMNDGLGSLEATFIRMIVAVVIVVLAAGVLVLLPVDIAWGRGLESPYLVSGFVALLTLGLLLGHQRRALGPPLTVLGAAGAAGMHLGLAPLVVAAGLVAGWDLIRQGSHRLLSLAG